MIRGGLLDWTISPTRLAGALLGQMGLKRRSRFAMAACLLGANAPDIDVFAPLALPVDGIEFHRGPLHGVFAWPVLAAAIVAILWLLDRLQAARPGRAPVPPRALVRRRLPRRPHPSVPRLADDLRHRACSRRSAGAGIRATRSSSSTGSTGC